MRHLTTASRSNSNSDSDNHQRRGSALLLVLFAVAILSFAVLQHIALVHYELEEAAFRAGQFRCQQLAESGISIAMLPTMANGDPALEQTPHPGESIKVQIRSESARLNINQLLKSEKTDTLTRLFTLWGVSRSDADLAVKALYDWTHPLTALPGVGSAPGTTGPDAPPLLPPMTRTFATVGDMAMLPEMDLVRKVNPDWADAFTIWGSGQLDLNEATPDLIAALCDISMSLATNFTSQRAGPDSLPFTADDIRYGQLNEALRVLQISAPPTGQPAGNGPGGATPITAFLTVSPSFRRIVSTGAVGSHHRTLHAIVRLEASSSPAILEWKE